LRQVGTALFPTSPISALSVRLIPAEWILLRGKEKGAIPKDRAPFFAVK
jgi:hypothetical protein